MTGWALAGGAVLGAIIAVIFVEAASSAAADMSYQRILNEKSFMSGFSAGIEPIPTVKIQYEDGIKPIKQAHEGEWYDIRSAETIAYAAGDKVKIRHGIRMELPAGYEAKILPRSSTYDRYGLKHVDSGLIDNDYRDEWISTFEASRSGIIRKNVRVAQFRLQKKQGYILFDVVSNVRESDRGGYGSTGEE